MGVEVADVEGRDKWVKFQAEEFVTTGWVLYVVVDVGDEEMVVSSEDFQKEEGWVRD